MFWLSPLCSHPSPSLFSNHPHTRLICSMGSLPATLSHSPSISSGFVAKWLYENVHLFTLLFKNVINSEHVCYKIPILIVIFLYCIKIKIFSVAIFLWYRKRETCPNHSHCYHHYIYFAVELWLVLSHSQKEAAHHIYIC